MLANHAFIGNVLIRVSKAYYFDGRFQIELLSNDFFSIKKKVDLELFQDYFLENMELYPFFSKGTHNMKNLFTNFQLSNSEFEDWFKIQETLAKFKSEIAPKVEIAEIVEPVISSNSLYILLGVIGVIGVLSTDLAK